MSRAGFKGGTIPDNGTSATHAKAGQGPGVMDEQPEDVSVYKRDFQKRIPAKAGTTQRAMDQPMTFEFERIIWTKLC